MVHLTKLCTVNVYIVAQRIHNMAPTNKETHNEAPTNKKKYSNPDIEGQRYDHDENTD